MKLQILALTITVLVFIGLGCSGSDSDEGVTRPDATPLGVGGIDGSPLETPIVHSTEAWTPPALDPAEFDNNRALDEAENKKPVFFGQVGEFRVFGAEDKPKEYPCSPNEANTVGDLPFVLSYYPPGSTEAQEPRVQVCPDGVVQLASRSFSIASTAFSVSFHGGEAAIYNDSFREGRLRAEDIKGSPAVVAEPLNESGYGESLVVWNTPSGYIRVYAIDLPFSEVMKIVDGIDCRAC